MACNCPKKKPVAEEQKLKPPKRKLKLRRVTQKTKPSVNLVHLSDGQEFEIEEETEGEEKDYWLCKC